MWIIYTSETSPPYARVAKMIGMQQQNNKTSWANARVKLHSQVHFRLWIGFDVQKN